ncbi:DUF222 domain-containing protein [Corynebacterium sp. NPDC060344]|uniref:DUF222 domain-containing protein n=1 Tax=Corynebacterium sp. NPDC060344 TaxID=3347101 RepID=UPI003651B0E1
MTTPAGCAADLLAAIDALADAATVATGAWDRLTRTQREAAYGRLETARKQLAVVDAQYLQARRDDAPVADGKIPAALARSQCISRGEARRRRAAHRRLSPGHQALGDAGNPDYMPCLRAKVEAGVIGADAVDKVDRVLRGFPHSVHAELTRVADPHIAELVEHVDVDDLDQLAPMLRAMLGIDDPYTDADRKRARGVRVGVQGHDGMSKISGQLTPHLAAILKRLAADHGRPGGLLPGGEAAGDERSASQRLHDALEAALAAGYGPGAFPAGDQGWGPGTAGADVGPDSGPDAGPAAGPDEGPDRESAGECSGQQDLSSEDGVTGPGVGPVPLIDPDFGAQADTMFDHTIDEASRMAEEPATRAAGAGRARTGRPPLRRRRLQPARGTTSVVVVATLDQLMDMTGVVMTDTNVHMSVSEAIENCDVKNLFLEVLDFNGEPLYLGRSERAGTMAQYLALLGAEGMSSAPGSSAPAAWCHIHHTEAWQFGGGTDLNLMTLVDPKTHANVDDSRRDPGKWWSRRGHGPGEPRIVWTPPHNDPGGPATPRGPSPRGGPGGGAGDPGGSGGGAGRVPRENQHPAAWANPGRALRRHARKQHAGNRRKATRETGEEEPEK